VKKTPYMDRRPACCKVRGPMTPRPAPAFTVIRFTFVHPPLGFPTQNRETIGRFDDAEDAFATARALAWNALCQLAGAGAPSGSHTGWEAAVRDTEWGYDLVHNGRIVDRFWVHDHHARELH
jgi:hypothetical protein